MAEDEIMFSYTDRILEVTPRDFSNILFNYIETCIHLRNELLVVAAAEAATQIDGSLNSAVATSD